jgi:uncharacterized protein YdcH (DUF465 family)
MLLRLSLVVAIVAGLAALYFTHFNVAERVNTLNDNLAQAETQARQSQTEAQRAREGERKALQEFEGVSQELADRTSTLEEVANSLSVQKQRADRLFEEHARVDAELRKVQQQISAYMVTGLSPDQVVGLRGQLTRVAEARDAFESEAQMLKRRTEDLARRLQRYEGPAHDHVELPVGLVGRVIAVDPRYDFVVLNIGAEDGVREDGQLLVNRNGQLVARIQITRVEPNVSIANVLPQWKQDDILEGDVVFY